MTYDIIWKREVVDTADDRKEAEYLRTEYNMAFGGGCTIKKNNSN